MEAPFDLSQTDKLLTTTRAVRRRLDLSRPVERKVIRDCIALSQQAPTGSNSQSWRWVVVTDADKRRQVAEVYKSNIGAYQAARDSMELDAQTERVMDSTEHLFQHMHKVPALVLACNEGKLEPGAMNVMQSSFFGSIYPAIWSFQLALRSRGLGSVLTTASLLKEDEMAKVLGLPDNITQVALMPVAYTIGTDFKPAKRAPVEDIIHWDSW